MKTKTEDHPGDDAVLPLCTAIGSAVTDNRYKYADYNFLKRHEGLYSAKPVDAVRKKYVTLKLAVGEADELFIKDLNKAYDSAIKLFPKFRTYPMSCQAAVIDMIFNLGETTFRKEYHKFQAAVQEIGEEIGVRL